MKYYNLINFLANNPCEDPDVLKIILYIRKILEVAFIIVPIVLIVLVTFDFIKNVTANSEDTMKKNQKIIIKRIIYCVMLFFVIPIVNIVFSIFGTSGQSSLIKAGDTNYLSCWDNAKSKKTIETFVIKATFKENGGTVFGEKNKSCGGKITCEVTTPTAGKKDSTFLGWVKEDGNCTDPTKGKVTLYKGESNVFKACFEAKQTSSGDSSSGSSGGSSSDSSSGSSGGTSGEIRENLPTLSYEDKKSIITYDDTTNKKVYVYKCPSNYYLMGNSSSGYMCYPESSFHGITPSSYTISKYYQGNYSNTPSACGGGNLNKKGCLPTSGAMIFSALENNSDITPIYMNAKGQDLRKKGKNVCSGSSYYVDFLVSYASSVNISATTYNTSNNKKVLEKLKNNTCAGVAPLKSKSGCLNNVKNFCYSVGHFVPFFVSEDIDKGYVNVIDPANRNLKVFKVSYSDLINSTQNKIIRLFCK